MHIFLNKISLSEHFPLRRLSSARSWRRRSGGGRRTSPAAAAPPGTCSACAPRSGTRCGLSHRYVLTLITPLIYVCIGWMCTHAHITHRYSDWYIQMRTLRYVTLWTSWALRFQLTYCLTPIKITYLFITEQNSRVV